MTAVRDRLFALLHDRTVPINLRLCQVLIEAQEAQWIWEEERWQALNSCSTASQDVRMPSGWTPSRR